VSDKRCALYIGGLFFGYESHANPDPLDVGARDVEKHRRVRSEPSWKFEQQNTLLKDDKIVEIWQH
jgi:hypothetical protein